MEVGLIGCIVVYVRIILIDQISIKNTIVWVCIKNKKNKNFVYKNLK